MNLRSASLWFIFMFALPGCFFVFYAGKLTHLRCYRLNKVGINCELHSSGIYKDKITAIVGLRNAELEETNTSRHHPRYRVILVSKNARIPFTEYTTEGSSRPRKNLEKIHAFLEDSTQTTLTVQQDDRAGMYFWSAIWILHGIYTVSDAFKAKKS